MKRAKMDYLLTILGIALMGVGLFFVKTSVDPQGLMRALPYVCVGLGCGCFGHGMGNTLSRKAIRTDPELEKQMEIEKSDERNIAIANRSKAKAFDVMTFVFGALMVAFALMGVDMVEVLLLVCAYIFVEGSAIYYRCKYDKEM